MLWRPLIRQTWSLMAEKMAETLTPPKTDDGVLSAWMRAVCEPLIGYKGKIHDNRHLSQSQHFSLFYEKLSVTVYLHGRVQWRLLVFRLTMSRAGGWRSGAWRWVANSNRNCFGAENNSVSGNQSPTGFLFRCELHVGVALGHSIAEGRYTHACHLTVLKKLIKVKIQVSYCYKPIRMITLP